MISLIDFFEIFAGGIFCGICLVNWVNEIKEERKKK